MGIYRRKDKEGKPFGPYVVQYPYCADPVTGRARYTTTTAGFSKRHANRVFSQKRVEWERKKHLGLEKKKDYHFRNLVEWYQKQPRTLSARSAQKIKQHCRTLKEHFGSHLAREIKPHMIEAYQHKRLGMTTRRGTPYRPASVNREVEVMKRIYNLAVREDMVERNPCLKVAKLPENNVRDRILSHAEFAALTEALPLHAADIVRMGYYTGMRFGEIVGLTWNRVNLREGCVHLSSEDTKTGEPRTVYLVPQAIEVLERTSRVRSLSHRHVFTYRGKPIRSIRVALNAALEKKGIRDFRFHDLRHTFNTNMRRSGVDRSVIMRFTGHKTLSMFLRYSTVDSEDARLAVAKFTDFLAREVESTAKSTSPEKKGLSDFA